MLKFILPALTAIGIAIFGGVSSVWWAVGAARGVVVVADWTADPDVGTPNANPYSKARSASEGSLVLGRAEGLAFVAMRDADGAGLRRDCRYTVEGVMPPARLWTLFPADSRTAPIGKASLSSYGALYRTDGSLVISVGREPAPGNWLRVEDEGELKLVLTLYDTPAVSRTGVSDIALPRVAKAGCDD